MQPLEGKGGGILPASQNWTQRVGGKGAGLRELSAACIGISGAPRQCTVMAVVVLAAVTLAGLRIISKDSVFEAKEFSFLLH